MKAQDWKRLTKPLVGGDWALDNDLLYLRPVEWVLHGVLWESSSAHPGAFYLWRLAMPLYTPNEFFDLSLSDRHGGGTKVYGLDDPATHDAVGAAMALVQERALRREILIDPPGGADNTLTQEIRGYGLFLNGNPSGAIEVLSRVARYDAKYDWEVDMVTRAKFVRLLIEEGEHEEVHHQLQTWRSGTLEALRIEP